MKLLYIDDNRLLADGVKKALSDDYIVDITHTGEEGIEQAKRITYSLILLDLGLPGMKGIEVCRTLRQAHISTPILVISAQKDPAISVELLNLGADDFVTKPFNIEVLKARIAALLRRLPDLQAEKVVAISDLEVNITRRQVCRRGIKILLRRKEFDILEYLASNRGRALTRSMILNHVWESDKESWNNTVDVHIKNLRDKIDRPFGHPLIKTAYGVGYIMEDST